MWDKAPDVLRKTYLAKATSYVELDLCLVQGH